MVKFFQKSNVSGLSPAKKLVLGFAGASAVAVVGSAGFAAAQQFTPSSNPTTPPSKAACKNGGWQSLGYKNQGQCVAAYEHSIGHGYGAG